MSLLSWAGVPGKWPSPSVPASPPGFARFRPACTSSVLHEIKKAKLRFGLPANAPVVSCYEAGRDGFWLHRFLLHQGIQNIVVDSASIEVSRRKRRAKSDRLDAIKLVSMLIRWHNGERKVWSVVHVPAVADEDRRQLHRREETPRKLPSISVRRTGRSPTILRASVFHCSTSFGFTGFSPGARMQRTCTTSSCTLNRAR